MKCCVAIDHSYMIVRAQCSSKGYQTKLMSQQLQISSLFSAFALVCLCLVARAGGEWGGEGEVRLGAGAGPIVQIVTQAE